MSRSGYSEDGDWDQWQHIMYRGRVTSATRGKRGQALLSELLEALDAMPEKRLVANEFQSEGAFCTLGVIGAKRGIDLAKFIVDEDEYDPRIGEAFNIAGPLAREIMWENDECVHVHGEWHEIEICGPMWFNDEQRRTRLVRVPIKDAEERRWRYMRSWVASLVKAKSAEGASAPEAKPATDATSNGETA